MKEQSPKAEAKSLGQFTFFTAVASSLNHSFDRGVQTTSAKGQMLKYFWICEPCGLCCDYSGTVAGKQP